MNTIEIVLAVLAITGWFSFILSSIALTVTSKSWAKTCDTIINTHNTSYECLANSLSTTLRKIYKHEH